MYWNETFICNFNEYLKFFKKIHISSHFAIKTVLLWRKWVTHKKNYYKFITLIGNSFFLAPILCVLRCVATLRNRFFHISLWFSPTVTVRMFSSTFLLVATVFCFSFTGCWSPLWSVRTVFDCVRLTSVFCLSFSECWSPFLCVGTVSDCVRLTSVFCLSFSECWSPVLCVGTFSDSVLILSSPTSVFCSCFTDCWSLFLSIETVSHCFNFTCVSSFFFFFLSEVVSVCVKYFFLFLSLNWSVSVSPFSCFFKLLFEPIDLSSSSSFLNFIFDPNDLSSPCGPAWVMIRLFLLCLSFPVYEGLVDFFFIGFEGFVICFHPDVI